MDEYNVSVLMKTYNSCGAKSSLFFIASWYLGMEDKTKMNMLSENTNARARTSTHKSTRHLFTSFTHQEICKHYPLTNLIWLMHSVWVKLL